jgi:hypothetical protein
VARNPDGTATCDACGGGLPGFGVLFGMVCIDLDLAAETREHIVCYGCRGDVLTGLVNFTADPMRCTDCDVKLDARSVATAMLVTDLSPADPGEARSLAFCYANGSRDLVLNNITEGTP